MLSRHLSNVAELRPLEPWQADEFFAHIERARDHIAPWVPIPHRVVDVATARAWLQRYADMQARDAGRVYGIWLSDHMAGEAATLVGGVMFPQFDAATGNCEVGVWLEPSAEGRYLVTTACVSLIDWAVNVRGIMRVEWHASPDNDRSRAVARRLGMTREGVLRSAFVNGGERQDTEVWSVLAGEWPPAAA